jgi:uncharacterized membrane protein
MLPPASRSKYHKEMYLVMCCLPIEVSDARFEVFMMVKIEFVVFWVVALCIVVVGYQCF